MMDIDRDEDAIVEECRVCGGSIYIDSDCEEEDIVYCNDCEAEYQILSLDPLRLSPLNDSADADEHSGDFGEYD